MRLVYQTATLAMHDSGRYRRPSLAVTFLENISDVDVRARFVQMGDLEDALVKLVVDARHAWPSVVVESSRFVEFVARVLSADTSMTLEKLRPGDMYLVCAYARNVRSASEIIEEQYMPKVERAVRRIGIPEHIIGDVQQDLRQRLFEMQVSDLERQGYSGRGDLLAWLRVTAVRAARRRCERAMRDETLETEDLSLLASSDDDPELSYLRHTYAHEFRLAFQEAFGSLESRERNVLRYHFLEGCSIDRIGHVYGVHRATAARWVQRARERLCARTREILAARISFNETDFQRMLNLIDTQISVELTLLER